MNKYLLITIFFTSLLIPAQPANGQRNKQKSIKITGKVIDKDTGEPLEFATLVLKSVNKPDLITGGITDLEGNFEVETSPGLYNISVEFISYKTFKKDNQQLSADTDLGTISVALDVSQLDEVAVVAERSSVELRLDKKIYNVGQDLTVRGGTVSDVLDNVPSVSVDADGAVQLRGNDDVRILINGKPSALVGLDGADGLSQLPAESIEKIEVITSPSARYDAEGSGGIINIILKRSKLQGLNGAITVNAGNPNQAGISGNLNYRTGNLNFFTNLGYNYRERPGNSFNDTDFVDEDGVFTNSLTEDNETERFSNNYNGNFGLEWYINETSSITQSIFYRYSDENNETTNNFFQVDIDGTESSGVRFTPEEETDRTVQYSFNYNKQFNGNSSHTLDFAFQYENSNELEEALITIDNIDSEFDRTDENQENILLSTDYVQPVGESGQFELGYRGDFTKLLTDFDVDFFDPTLDELGISDPSNLLDYSQSINAFYTQYGDKYGKFSFLSGLRFEATRLIINQLETNDFNTNNFSGFFPTLNLNYELSETGSLQFGYSRRIRRPRSGFLNPFPNRTSATNFFQGNPNLLPSLSNQVDIGYLNRFKKITLSSSLYYQRSTDVITFITEDSGEDTLFDGEIVSIVRRTPVNLASNERYGLEGNINYRPAKNWSANLNLNVFELITRGDFNGQNFDAENLSYFIRLNNKITLPAKIDWQTRLFFVGPSRNAQTETQGIFSTSLAFSKDLFKDKASISLNISDVFNSNRRRRETVTTSFESFSESQRRVRSGTLSFTYRFNQKKKRNQEGDRDDDDDDFEG